MANKRILIIDDDVELCEETAEALRNEGYSVKNTADPLRGWDFSGKQNFDIVILDYKMPGLNGIELLKYIKKISPGTKVFITSGRPFIEKLIDEEKAACLVAGIINKPFSCVDMLEKIEKAD